MTYQVRVLALKSEDPSLINSHMLSSDHCKCSTHIQNKFLKRSLVAVMLQFWQSVTNQHVCCRVVLYCSSGSTCGSWPPEGRHMISYVTITFTLRLIPEAKLHLWRSHKIDLWLWVTTWGNVYVKGHSVRRLGSLCCRVTGNQEKKNGQEIKGSVTWWLIGRQPGD